MKTGEKKQEIKNSNMKTVYAIEYDPFNQVIHAATGQNSYMPSFGLTFSAEETTFGNLVQRWQPDQEVSFYFFVSLEINNQIWVFF